MNLATEKKGSRLRDKPWLPIILWLIPIIALNICFDFVARIDFMWASNEQEESAKNEAEALAAASDYSYQFAKYAGRFKKSFLDETGAEAVDESLTTRLKRHENEIFKQPFPDYNLFVFKLPNNSSRASLLYEHTDSKSHSKLAMTKTFELLVSHDEGTFVSSAASEGSEKWFQGLFGKHTLSEIIALSQKGRTTYVLWQKRPACFIWHSFKDSKNDTYGFYLLTSNTTACDSNGRKLALADFCRKNRHTGNLAAFVPVFDKYAGNLIPKKLSGSLIFKRWAKKLLTDTDEKRYLYLKSNSHEPAALGNYKAYTFIGRSQTHMAVCLMPNMKAVSKPDWLKAVTAAGLFLIVIMLLRGFLLGKWPSWGLKLRFLMIYFLSAALPISLFIASAAGYLLQYQSSSYFETISKLKGLCQQFDARKDLLSSEYQTTFNLVLNSTDVQNVLKEPPSEKRDKKVGDELIKIYKNRPHPLPIMALAIIDPNNKVIIRTEGPAKIGQDAVECFSGFLAKVLGDEIKKHTGVEYPAPKLTDRQKAILGAYESVSGHDMHHELNKRRSFKVEIKTGARTIARMHESIKIDGKPAYMFMAIWRSDALDDLSYQQTLDQFGLTNADSTFIGCRMKPEPEFFIVDKTRRLHMDKDFVANAPRLAEQSYFRHGSAQQSSSLNYMVAVPAQKYEDTVFVAGTNKIYSEREMRRRIIIFAVILFLSVLIITACSLYSSELIIKPIASLQSALERVSRGMLQTEIQSSREDEIGNLCLEFTTMTAGLRERKRLATLISDRAITAIKTAESGENLRGRSFSAVVLSSDIRNFTGMSETYPPEQITDMLNSHIAAMSTAISQYGGQIYKFIGDAVEAIFEENEDQKESASVRAFKAAVLMLQRKDNLNQMRERKRLFQYRMGIGLYYGDLSSGTVGSNDTRMDYAIIGEPLKKAAKFEALTKNVPDFPLTMDRHVAAELKSLKMRLIQLDETSGAYILDDESIKKAKALNHEETLQSGRLFPETAAKEEFVKVNVDTRRSPGLSFVFALLLIVMAFFGVIYLDDFQYDLRIKREKANIEDENQRLLEQVVSDTSPTLAYETNCRKFVQSLEKLPIDNRNFLTEKLPAILKSKVGNPLKPGCLAENISYFSFLRKDEIGTATIENLQPVFNEGWSAEDIETSRVVFLDILTRCYSGETRIAPQGIDYEKFQRVFGNGIDTHLVVAECLSSVYKAKLSDGEWYIYFDIIVNDRQSTRPGLFAETSSQQINGILFTKIRCESLKTPMIKHYVMNAFEMRDQKLALIKGDTVQYSDTCPRNLSQYIKDRAEQSGDSYCLSYREWGNATAAAIKHINARKLFNSGSSIAIPGIAALLLIAGAWFTLYRSTPIGRSLSVKLWLMLLFTSLIPLTSVFMVFSLFIDEDRNVSTSNARSELNRFIDNFEVKQYYNDPVLIETLKNITVASSTMDMVSKINKESAAAGKISPENEKKLSDWLRNWSNKITRGVNRNMYKFDLSLGAICGNNWAVSPEGKMGEVISSMAADKADMYVASRRNAPKLNPAEELKKEETVSMVMLALKAILGDDFYVKFTNLYETPIKMVVVDSEALFLTNLAPGEFNSEYLCLWPAAMRYDDFLHEIAVGIYEGRFEAISGDVKKHGKTGSYKSGSGRHLMNELAAWIHTANTPINRIIKGNGSEYFVSIRPGILQFSSMVGGAVSLDDITTKLHNYRNNFNMLMLILVIIMLATAAAAASDILSPINSLLLGMRYAASERYNYRININRTDELGNVCTAFDAMIKGLEEKSMMGKMLSRNAREFSENGGGESRSAKYICLFVGIPGFATLTAGLEAHEIFADLRPHIAAVSRAIIEEGGDIDKIMGEKVLAIFNAEDNPEKAAASACKAALKIMELERTAQIAFPPAIGINYGGIIAGLLGVGEKRDFTVIGDAVNVAARVESLAEGLPRERCVLSEMAAELTDDRKFTLQEFGEVELKGKAKPMKVYMLKLR